MENLIPLVECGSPEVQYCYVSFLKAYIMRSVGMEPTKPENWAYLDEVRSCSRENCDKCAKVNAFLEDPEIRETTIDLGDDDMHVKLTFSNLFNFNLHYKPQIVVHEGREIRFIKTRRKWGSSHRDWESRAEKAKCDLRKLPKNKLEQLLGDQYNTLMALDLVRANGRTAEQSEVGQAPDIAPSSFSAKRQRDEDLDDAENASDPKRARES